MSKSDPPDPASAVLPYATPRSRSWRPRSPFWLLFCVLPILLLLITVVQAEYYNYITCWALPLRRDLPPHARWHDFRDERDWRINMLGDPAAETRPLTATEFAQMTYELKRGPMGGELGSAVTLRNGLGITSGFGSPKCPIELHGKVRPATTQTDLWSGHQNGKLLRPHSLASSRCSARLLSVCLQLCSCYG